MEGVCCNSIDSRGVMCKGHFTSSTSLVLFGVVGALLARQMDLPSNNKWALWVAIIICQRKLSQKLSVLKKIQCEKDTAHCLESPKSVDVSPRESCKGFKAGNNLSSRPLTNVSFRLSLPLFSQLVRFTSMLAVEVLWNITHWSCKVKRHYFIRDFNLIISMPWLKQSNEILKRSHVLMPVKLITFSCRQWDN